jgi:excisionase family DNA binding protein
MIRICVCSRGIGFDVALNGAVGVRWDSGFRLSLVPGVDRWRVVDTYLAPFEAAERLGLTLGELEQLIERGQIRAYRLDSGILYFKGVDLEGPCVGTMTRLAERP